MNKALKQKMNIILVNLKFVELDFIIFNMTINCSQLKLKNLLTRQKVGSLIGANEICVQCVDN